MTESIHEICARLGYTRHVADGIQAALERQEARDERERREAAYFHDQEPGRWGDEASPARMRRDVAREREEDR